MSVKLPIVVKLKYPVKWGQENVDSIKFDRRLKAKDMKGIPASKIQFEHMIKLLAKLTGIAETMLDEIDGEDIMTVMEVVQGFLPSGQATGDSH